jgi:hypothetical protein
VAPFCRMPWETNSTTRSPQDFEPIKHMLIDQANRQTRGSTKYSLVPWMALNVVNNLRLNNLNDGPTGTLRTAATCPTGLGFPSKSPSGHEPRSHHQQSHRHGHHVPESGQDQPSTHASMSSRLSSLTIDLLARGP